MYSTILLYSSVQKYTELYNKELTPLFNISSSYRSMFLSFIVPIFAWNIPLGSLIFLKRCLVFPILLFSSIYFHWSFRKAIIPLLAILWNSAFRWVYLSFSFPFMSLLFFAICKGSLDNHFAFLHSFFLGMVLKPSPVQCYEPPSIVLRALWQNMLHRRKEWQTTSVFLACEPHEQYEKAKR